MIYNTLLYTFPPAFSASGLRGMGCVARLEALEQTIADTVRDETRGAMLDLGRSPSGDYKGNELQTWVAESARAHSYYSVSRYSKHADFSC